MSANPLSGRGVSNSQEQTGGTPEDMRLTVKLLGDDWIVENAVGSSIGCADDRETAIELARESALSQNASSISVLAADGSLEESVRV